MNGLEFIISVAQKGLLLQDEKGSMPSGHNGPYLVNETPVRNTSHWLILFAKAYKITNKEIFKDCVEKAANYLTNKNAWPNNASFLHIKDASKDKSNGVIGAAWTIEALYEASCILDDKKYSDIAEVVLLKHEFIEKLGVWKRLSINGETGRIDQTFNHQLWLAACSSLLLNTNSKKKSEIKRNLELFLSKIPENIFIYSSGLIHHPIVRKMDVRSRLNEILKLIVEGIESLTRLNKSSKRNKIQYLTNIYWKSIGYHSFNTYAFALLKTNTQDSLFWQSKLIENITNFLLSSEYKKSLDIENYYGFPYNPPGFEIPYSIEVLSAIQASELVAISNFWVSEQIKRHFNWSTMLMDIDTKDVNTNTARIYELCRVSDSVLNQIVINDA